ncbi:uncharacterized protein N7500_001015 [Penicillium coprophilum]|uniref:uncharacterized protein n=1 Tax=Penicillium coprophilum TaxID=36646 RepID=UPI00239C4E99|nr:uncharacterized protein N7500_001015 [Penicillium coprophilum]KAJ5178316.1 hypothetical protein N7500_001015 [Penicillium coprophilum]
MAQFEEGRMAMNMHRKSPASDVMLMYEANPSAAEKAVAEANGNITIAPGLGLLSRDSTVFSDSNIDMSSGLTVNTRTS